MVVPQRGDDRAPAGVDHLLAGLAPEPGADLGDLVARHPHVEPGDPADLPAGDQHARPASTASVSAPSGRAVATGGPGGRGCATGDPGVAHVHHPP